MRPSGILIMATAFISVSAQNCKQRSAICVICPLLVKYAVHREQLLIVTQWLTGALILELLLPMCI
ncbi:unnamed protein product [Fusarium fujikuroi]|uniref:Uncharacterized protein n=1 Tax=Fusarium fujikuroi TaxID=5127 RepID=A0A9Q9UH81_FUSFU|nr:unnamed protein product [Fusarium fujikuroi]VTT83828.1 unnamed protein product [Fusarium fujikuroi]VZH95769.1 unnamed protein product [Fusarium fujikuroi]